MKAREVIEAEGPKAFLKQASSNLPLAYRFSVGDPAKIAFQFTIIAKTDDEAVRLANQYCDQLGDKMEPFEDPIAGPVIIMPQEPLTTEDILDREALRDVFRDPDSIARDYVPGQLHR